MLCSEPFLRLVGQIRVFRFSFFSVSGLLFSHSRLSSFRTGCCSLVECGMASIEHQKKKSETRVDLFSLSMLISVLVLRLVF